VNGTTKEYQPFKFFLKMKATPSLQYRKPFLQPLFLAILLLLLSTQSIWAFQPTTTASLASNPIPQGEAFAVPEQPQDISPLLTGESIPTLILADASDKPFKLNQSISQKPTILLFYRGGWCPFCTKQLSGIQAIEADLAQLGYQIIAISTDSPKHLSETLGQEKLSYTLLSDSELTAAKQFGIAYKGPKNYDETLIKHSDGKNTDKLLPVPSVFIVDKKGVIRFEYINPNVTERISPQLLKAAAGALVEDLQANK
jgi:peroxiredoxin